MLKSWGKNPVIACNGSAIVQFSKQIEWIWSSLEERFVVMLGGLHIEMTIPNMLGKWVDGSGWSSALVEAGITVAIPGKVLALLSASHVKRSCYAHQVYCCFLIHPSE